jgi:hypothetical protein
MREDYHLVTCPAKNRAIHVPNRGPRLSFEAGLLREPPILQLPDKPLDFCDTLKGKFSYGVKII